MTSKPLNLLPFLALGLSALALSACDPQATIDGATRRAAAEVVEPVVAREMPAAPAKAATECILQAASIEEIRALARDIGVEAGTQTKENIRNLALRPAAQSCFATSGVPPVTP
ncbi:MAG: hypothetical protein R3D63_10950 [Paracoccaceae bacterium]